MAIVARDGVDGKVCSKCQEWKGLDEFQKCRTVPDGHQYWCKSCLNAAGAAYRERNRQMVQEKDRIRGRTDKKRQASSAAYHRLTDEQRAQRREKIRQWYARTREIRYETQREWLRRNPEKRRVIAQRWREKNPEKEKLYKFRRRLRVKQNGGEFTPQQWEAIKRIYRYCCPGCGRSEPEIVLTIDHVQPLACGGTNDARNLQPLCKECNGKKWKRAIRYLPWDLQDHDGSS